MQGPIKVLDVVRRVKRGVMGQGLAVLPPPPPMVTCELSRVVLFCEMLAEQAAHAVHKKGRKACQEPKNTPRHLSQKGVLDVVMGPFCVEREATSSRLYSNCAHVVVEQEKRDAGQKRRQQTKSTACGCDVSLIH